MSQPGNLAELRQQWLLRFAGSGAVPSAQELDAVRLVLRTAIEALKQVLRDPERDRQEVFAIASALSAARVVARREDIPALIELARVAREVRGPGSQYAEEAALNALVEVADEGTVSFLAESLRFSRPHDGSAGHRRGIVQKGIAAIALLTANREALALLDEALTHRAYRTRLAACRAIREVASMTQEGLPPHLAEGLRQVVHRDPSRDVRVCAEIALEEAGENHCLQW